MLKKVEKQQEEALKELAHVKRTNRIHECSDTEALHEAGDNILIDFLRGVGADKLADAYNKLDKKYRYGW